MDVEIYYEPYYQFSVQSCTQRKVDSQSAPRGTTRAQGRVEIVHRTDNIYQTKYYTNTKYMMNIKPSIGYIGNPWVWMDNDRAFSIIVSYITYQV
eukprot:SAG31_NODE_266_length_18815_cov_17.009243_17_plen_95_part_00